MVNIFFSTTEQVNTRQAKIGRESKSFKLEFTLSSELQAKPKAKEGTEIA